MSVLALALAAHRVAFETVLGGRAAARRSALANVARALVVAYVTARFALSVVRVRYRSGGSSPHAPPAASA